MMSIPGLALFYGGIAGQKHVLSVLWITFGYSLTFGRGSVIIGGSERFWLTGDGSRVPPMTPSSSGFAGRRPHIPEAAFVLFQCAFAVVAAALTIGSFAERMRFWPTVAYIFLWHLLVYCPVAHWEWSEEGFLRTAGVMDFAGFDTPPPLAPTPPTPAPSNTRLESGPAGRLDRVCHQRYTQALACIRLRGAARV
jgi:ammonium transporter, Amt family